jgi:DNA processing protein
LDITEALAPMAGELARALRRRLGEEDRAGAERVAEEAPLDDLLEDQDYASLWEALGHDTLTQDQLLGRVELDARELSSMLLMLELRGLVHTLDGGRVARRLRDAAMKGP